MRIEALYDRRATAARCVFLALIRTRAEGTPEAAHIHRRAVAAFNRIDSEVRALERERGRRAA